MRLSYIFLVIVISGFSCKPATYTLQDYTGKKLLFANGGGFTGQVIEYTVFENGQVFRKNSMTGNTSELPRIMKNDVTQLFSNYYFLGLDRVDLKNPGNMYFYIVMADGDHEHKILWNLDAVESVDQNILLFYKSFMNWVKD